MKENDLWFVPATCLYALRASCAGHGTKTVKAVHEPIFMPTGPLKWPMSITGPADSGNIFFYDFLQGEIILILLDE